MGILDKFRKKIKDDEEEEEGEEMPEEFERFQKTPEPPRPSFIPQDYRDQLPRKLPIEQATSEERGGSDFNGRIELILSKLETIDARLRAIEAKLEQRGERRY